MSDVIILLRDGGSSKLALQRTYTTTQRPCLLSHSLVRPMHCRASRAP
jgi:hypothetical protein